MKQTSAIASALLAGIAGGMLGTLLIHKMEQLTSAQVVRARSFELLDERGQVISFWGVDSAQETVLVFGSRGYSLGGERPNGQPSGLANIHNQLAVFGLQGNDSPLLKMNAADGTNRVRLLLSEDGKPALSMKDKGGLWLDLGIEQSDTPGPQDNDWALSMGRALGPPIARIGMAVQTVGGQPWLRGGVFADGKGVRHPAEAFK